AARARSPLLTSRQGRRAVRNRRERTQPARHPGAPARRRTAEGGGMSTAMDALEPLVAELPRREAPLRPVEPAQRRRPRVAYALTALLGALAIAAAQMGLSIATTETTYRVSELTQQQRELTWQKQAQYDAIAGRSSPQDLAANAASLRMGTNQSPTYPR